MQKLVKDELMGMDGVGTIMNVADLGTKRLTRARREFLMYLLNLVFFSNDTGKFEPVGKEEYENFWAKKAMASDMKEVRRVMLRTLADGTSWRPRISTKMVKAITILGLQPGVQGFQVSDIQDVITVAVVNSYEVSFFKVTMFLVYTMVVFMVGMWFGYLHWVHVRRVRRRVIEMQENAPALDFVRSPVMAVLARITGRQAAPTDFAEPNPEPPEQEKQNTIYDWDLFAGEMRDFRILQREEDAMCGEEWFEYCHSDTSYHRRYKKTSEEIAEEKEEEAELERSRS